MTINHEAIKTGEYLIIGFGNGTQGIKVIGTTAKRLEIIRCQQYLSERPFWTGAISKISRTDKRIMHAWEVPAKIADAAPSVEEISETKEVAKQRAACSKFVNKALKPFDVAISEWKALHFETAKDGYYRFKDEIIKYKQDEYWDVYRLLSDRRYDARNAAKAEWSEKNGRDEYGRKL